MRQGGALIAASLLQSLPWLAQGSEGLTALLLTLTGGLTLAPTCLVIWHYLTSTVWRPLGPSLVSQPVNWRGRHLIWYLLLFTVSLWLQLGLPAELSRFTPFCLALPIIALAWHYGWQGALIATLMNAIALIASQTWHDHPVDLLLSLLAQSLTGLLLGAGIQRLRELNLSLQNELARNRRLAERLLETEESVRRDVARELLHSHGLGQGREFCEKLARQAGLDQGHPALQRWQASLHETQNDREVVELYAKLVQPVLDNQARREISRSAAESTLMIAVSPLALVDMAFIAWRNIRLINRIAALYGIELGYFSRIRLFRLVLLNIAFAGASELVREVGMDWMSQDLAARLSARAAQGIGAGLLTARLGIKAMELCRPLPWIADDKPRLGDFRRELIGQLKETLQKSKTGAEK